MRKFILTSSKFTGQVQIIFINDEIASIDFANSQLSVAQKKYILQHINIAIFGLEEFVKETKLICVETNYEITFEMFWNKYNMKLDRKRTLAVWDKLSKTKQVAAYMGIQKYDNHLRRTDWRNKMEPKTYLKNERWDDEWK